MNYSKQPKPSKILNIAASQSGILAALFTPNNLTAGTLPYTLQSPIVSSDCILFVEHGACPMHPLKRSLGWSISIACLVPAILTTGFVIAEGFSIDGFYLILGMTIMSGIAVAFVMLCLVWNFRTLALWPVVIETHSDGIRVTLAHRQHWCMLNTLSPSLATGEFKWIDGRYGKPLHPKKLPDSLKDRTHACWLELKYKTRKRWVLLSLFENDEEASNSTLEWAQKLELSGDDVFTTNDPPSSGIYNYSTTKLW